MMLPIKSFGFILMLAGSVTLFTACPKKGCTDPKSFNYDPEAKKDDGSCLEMQGCLGYGGGMNQSGSKGTTLYDAYYDQKMSEEVVIQRGFFGGVNATVWILYENSYDQRNAYATTSGEILFGYHMFYYTISNFNELAAAGILAHEWGHRCQYTFGWNANQQNPVIELEADAISGYYMALQKGFAWSQIDGYFSSTYATGDYNFNSPLHHGTPDQRLAAAYLGVELAVEAANAQQSFSYTDLHQRIIDSITTNIVRRPNPDGGNNSYSELREIAMGRTHGKNIQRKPLTEAEIARLHFESPME